MIFLQTVIAFIVVIGTLVVVHEFGHYLVARWCGVKVLRFSVGMGKIIFCRRFGADQTEWVISALPLGGYVKMLDAREQDLSSLAPQDLQREFTRQNVWRRIAIVLAGPLANLFFAILLLTAMFINGVPEPLARTGPAPEKSVAFQAGLRGGELITAVNAEAIRTWSELRWKLMQLIIDKRTVHLDVERPNPQQPAGKLLDVIHLQVDFLSAEDLEKDFLAKLGLFLARPAILGKILPDGPAMRANLQAGDRVVRIDGATVSDGASLIEIVRASPDIPLKISVLRGQNELEIIIVPVAQNENGRTLGKINAEVISMPEMIVTTYPLFEAIGKATGRTWDTSILTLKMLGKMIVGEVSLKNITGPITIADYAGQTARIGMVSFISFIAFVSISLGVMNLLPIPVLDGGLLLYYSLEVLTGHPVSERFEEIAQRAGMGILMALMIVAIFNDVVRLIP